MKGQKKRIGSLGIGILILLLLALCGCGAGSKSESVSSAAVSTESTAENTEYTYRKVACDSELIFSDISVANGVLYEIVYQDNVYQVLQDDGETQKTLYTENASDTYLLCVAVNENSIWLVQSTWVAEDDEGNGHEDLVLLQLDKSGNIVLSVAIQELSDFPAEEYVYDLILNEKGWPCIQLAQSVLVLDGEGTYQYALTPQGDYVDGLLHTGGGKLLLASATEDGTVLARYAAGETEPEYTYTADDGSCFSGSGNYDFYCATNEGLSGVWEDSEAPLISWSETGIYFNFLQSLFAMDADFLCIDNGKLYRLERVRADEVTEPSIITLGTFKESTNLTSTVRDFNAKGTGIYIQVKNYCEDDTSETDALLQLNIDFLNGEAPDLIDFTGLTYDSYAEKGLLQNLLVCFEEDPDLDAEDFYLTDILQENGALYCISPSFAIWTWCTDATILADGNGWTYAQMLELLEQYPERYLVGNITKMFFLNTALRFYLTDSIDWEAGTCDFEGEEFLQILEAANTVSDTVESTNLNAEYALVEDGTALLNSLRITSVYDIANAESTTDLELSYVGWPTPSGRSGSYFSLSSVLTMNANSQNKDAAWEFIKYAISDDEVQNNVSRLPIQKSTLLSEVEEALSATEDESEKVTQEQIDTLFQLIEDTNIMYKDDPRIIPIIDEEVEYYFYGDKTAEEVAHIIQSRLSIYLAEQQ